MRAEEELSEIQAELEAQELARAIALADVENKAQEEDERAVDELPLSVRRYTEVVQAVHALAAGERVDYEKLVSLTDEERAALEELAVVLSGRDGMKFLYAEDRLFGLNRSLAVLQPVLALAMNGAGVDVLQASFAGVVDQINDLRDRLHSLEEAEDLVMDQAEQKAEDDDDDDDGEDGDDDKPKDAVPPAAAAAPKRPDDEPVYDPATDESERPTIRRPSPE